MAGAGFLICVINWRRYDRFIDVDENRECAMARFRCRACGEEGTFVYDGHTHEGRDFFVRATRIVNNAKGTSETLENRHVDPNCVIEIRGRQV
jgi:hypothetical protein